MILDSLKPESLSSLCEQISRELAAVEDELTHYDRALQGNLDASQQTMLHQHRTRRARTAALLRARLDALQCARYHDDPQTVWARTLRVA